MIQVTAPRSDPLIRAGKDRQCVLRRSLRLGAQHREAVAQFVGHVSEVTTGRAILAAQTARILGMPQTLDVPTHHSLPSVVAISTLDVLAEK